MCTTYEETLSRKLESSGKEADSKSDSDSISGIQECIGHWVEIRLLDEFDKPLVNTRCFVVTPKGYTHGLRSTKDGTIRVERLAEGKVQIGFPDFDESAWVEVT